MICTSPRSGGKTVHPVHCRRGVVPRPGLAAKLCTLCTVAQNVQPRPGLASKLCALCTCRRGFVWRPSCAPCALSPRICTPPRSGGQAVHPVHCRRGVVPCPGLAAKLCTLCTVAEELYTAQVWRQLLALLDFLPLATAGIPRAMNGMYSWRCEQDLYPALRWRHFTPRLI